MLNKTIIDMRVKAGSYWVPKGEKVKAENIITVLSVTNLYQPFDERHVVYRDIEGNHSSIDLKAWHDQFEQVQALSMVPQHAHKNNRIDRRISLFVRLSQVKMSKGLKTEIENELKLLRSYKKRLESQG